MHRRHAGRLLAVAMLIACANARADDGTLERGLAVYRERCAICHGRDGRGDGDGVWLLLRPPRNFRTARFRFVSTWDRLPTDDDLYGTVTRGLPGSQMPSFATVLTEADRRAVVAAVKSFADAPWSIAPSRPPGPDGSSGRGVVVVPPEPPDAATNLARGAELFRDACATCHGADGRGDGRTDLVDADGRLIRPRDFVLGWLKGDPSPEALYRRIIVGVPGTPMPANDWAYGDDAWYLVRYVLSLRRPGLVP